MDVTAISKNGMNIRLTEERWKHICLMHPNIADKQDQILNTIENPSYILKGKAGELLAVGSLKRLYLVVVYKEVEEDGFIITAFETTGKTWLFKKELIWSKHL